MINVRKLTKSPNPENFDFEFSERKSSAVMPKGEKLYLGFCHCLASAAARKIIENYFSMILYIGFSPG